jgi:ABC-type transport system substrate-binding protein
VTSTAGHRPPERGARSPVIRDRAVTGLLVAVLAAAAFAIALPRAAGPASGEGTQAPSAPASPAAPSGLTVYREGVVGRPTSVTPVTARNRADRTLVGLIYSGLVKVGPGNTLVPDLAASWKVDKSGQTWTVQIRPDAAWQDGQPVTADDVVYTVEALKDPSAAGGLAAAWADVAVEAVDAKTVRFTLGSPVGGFLAALTQPLLPSHLLTGVPMSDLATGDFAKSPVGSGPYQLVQLDDNRAILVPAGATAPATSPSPSASAPEVPNATSSAGASASGTASSSLSSRASPAAGTAGPAGASARPSAAAAASSPAATPSPSPTPTPIPGPNARPVERIEVTFYDTEEALAAAFQAGAIDGAAGLSAATTRTLASLPGASVLADPNVRKALLGAIDRSSIATTALGGQARVADALIPPESWAYDAAKVTQIGYDRSGAAKLLTGAGWTRTGGKWTAPKGKKPYAIELLTVPGDVNPRLAAVADAVRQSWTALGLSVTVTPLSGTELAARLKSGDFTAALLDIESGLEPDLFPLLDSSQVRANGSNRSGYQDPALDRLLEAARKPGTLAVGKAAWSALLGGLSVKLPVLPIVWADEQMVDRGLSGSSQRLIVNTGDRYWDVLAWRLAASQ